MTPSKYFDVRLVEITSSDTLVLEYQGHSLTLATLPNAKTEWDRLVADGTSSPIGQVGWVHTVKAPEGVVGPVYQFRAYLDQSLRRAYELDGEEYQDEHRDLYRWGWRNAKQPGGFRAPSHVVPGIDGQFIEDETQMVHIPIPPEFDSLCHELGIGTVEVLKGFIADVCGLHDFTRCPRADGFCTLGSDERRLAGEYLERAYGRVETDATVEDA